MIRFNPLSKDPDEIERMWYVPPRPAPASGWLLYSEEFVLGILQDHHNEPELIRRTGAWKIAALVLRAVMAVGQALLMLWAKVPVLSWFLYSLARGFPRNAAGFFLRGCYWKAKLRRLGVDTLIDQGVEITRPGAVEIGSRCHIDRDVLLSVGADHGYIRIGDFNFVGPACHVAGRGGVDIGRCVGLSARVHIYSVSNQPFHPQRLGELISMSHTVPLDDQNTVEAPVEIGDYAVVGLGAMILPGVTIGRGAVVHAYAEVASSCPKFAILSGHGRAAQKGWRRPGRLDPRLDDQQNQAGAQT